MYFKLSIFCPQILLSLDKLKSQFSFSNLIKPI
jgi:hypothetical protein